jgi:hypothetical protein
MTSAPAPEILLAPARTVSADHFLASGASG